MTDLVDGIPDEIETKAALSTFMSLNADLTALLLSLATPEVIETVGNLLNLGG